jgi:hypothetical protein
LRFGSNDEGKPADDRLTSPSCPISCASPDCQERGSRSPRFSFGRPAAWFVAGRASGPDRSTPKTPAQFRATRAEP